MRNRTYNLDWGIFSLIEFIGSNSEKIGDKFRTCIDIGSGEGVQTEILRHAGLRVFQVLCTPMLTPSLVLYMHKIM